MKGGYEAGVPVCVKEQEWQSIGDEQGLQGDGNVSGGSSDGRERSLNSTAPILTPIVTRLLAIYGLLPSFAPQLT